MPYWGLTIDLKDVFHSDLPFPSIRDEVVARINRSGWLDQSYAPAELLMALFELQDAQDADDFDVYWNAVYDIADVDRVWIATA